MTLESKALTLSGFMMWDINTPSKSCKTRKKECVIAYVFGDTFQTEQWQNGASTLIYFQLCFIPNAHDY